MLMGICLAVLAVLAAWGLHYGYKMAFYYEDPQASPCEYGVDDQIEKCRGLLNDCIGAFEGAPYESVQIRSRDGLILHGKYYHVADGTPLEIQLHGYKGNAIRDFSGNWRIAREAGRNVLLVDQRCHGNSEGHTITFGILERYDCLEWIRYANQRFGNIPIMITGVSMGAATVLMASGLELPANVKAVIADCPYDAPSNIIKKVLEKDMGLPVKLVYPLIRVGSMVYGRFNLNGDSPVAAVRRAKVPILLIHGDDDRFVPYDMSCNIHAAAPETVEFHTIPGAGHALNYMTAPEEYHRIVHAFTEKYLK